MAKYNWDKDASKYHINLHRDTLIAAINYCDRRDLDEPSKQHRAELKDLESFYKLKPTKFNKEL